MNRSWVLGLCVASLVCLAQPALSVEELLELDLPTAEPTVAPLPTAIPTVKPTVIPTPVPVVPTETVPVEETTLEPTSEPASEGTVVETPLEELDIATPEITPTPIPKAKPVKPLTPVKPSAKPVTSKAAKKPVKDSIPDEAANILEEYGFLEPGIKEPDGEIVRGFLDTATLFGRGDKVMIQASATAKVVPGRTFIIYHELKNVPHPVTKKPFGTIIYPIGQASVESIEGDLVLAQITKSKAGIRLNDKAVFLGTWGMTVADPTKAKAALRAMVICGDGAGRTVFSERDVIFIDKGHEDGVFPGDHFKLVKDAPMEELSGSSLLTTGSIKILGTTPTTSVARVEWSREYFQPGQIVERSKTEE